MRALGRVHRLVRIPALRRGLAARRPLRRRAVRDLRTEIETLPLVAGRGKGSGAAKQVVTVNATVRRLDQEMGLVTEVRGEPGLVRARRIRRANEPVVDARGRRELRIALVLAVEARRVAVGGVGRRDADHVEILLD